jgi:hypothetical protein
MRTDPGLISVSGMPCAHVVLDVSYRLSMEVAGTHLPVDVKATVGFDVTNGLTVERLPFGHGAISLITGLEKVDDPIVERLATVHGYAIRKVVAVTRQIEGGPPNSETVTEILEGFRDAVAATGAFDLPAGFKYQEPMLIGPTRK